MYDYEDYYENNPPWADKIFRRYGDTIAQALLREGKDPATWMPIDAPQIVPPVSSNPKEFGCGHYGCVYATEMPNIVIKLTSDKTEAFFVSVYMHLINNGWQPPQGIVRYYGIYDISGATYRSNPVYVLWREEAYNVGVPAWKNEMIRAKGDDKYARRMADVTGSLIATYKRISSEIYQLFKNSLRNRQPEEAVELMQGQVAMVDSKWGVYSDLYERIWEEGIVPTYYPRDDEWFNVMVRAKSDNKPSWLLYVSNLVADEMENNDGAHLIGQAFKEFYEQGMLLADVHLNNIGYVHRPDDPEWQPSAPVITDPGHVIPLNVAIAEIKPEVI